MRNRLWRILTFILVLSLILPVVALAAPVDPNTDGLLQAAQATGGKRFIVQLEGDPLAVHFAKLGAPKTMSRADGKLDVFAPEAQSYVAQLRRQQAEAISALQRTIPGARLAEYVDEFGRHKPLTYQIVLNGFVVELPKVDRETLIKLSRLPGVKAVTVEHQVELNLEVINPTIGATAVWSQLGGVDVAGEGIKVAVIDTGIDPNHPALDPTGYSYPVGYPKGDTRYTTPKVIVVRGVYRADDPPVPPAPLPLHPHGTGTATIIGTNPNTVATYKGVDVTVSGVAPKVYLMSYQIFYPSASGSTGRYASDPETVKAIELMVADGADVVNNSWGESAFIPLKAGFNPVIDALDAAVQAGVVVVKSAGNAGRSGFATVGGNDQPVNGISVGATVNTRAFGNEAAVTGPGDVPSILQSMLATPAAFGGTITQDLEGVFVYVGRIHQGNGRACDPIDDPNGELQGKIALISRGACYFTTKVQNAQDAGAIAAIVFNNVPGAPPITMGGTSETITIPAFMVGNPQGLEMVQFEAAHPGEATVRISAQTARITNIAPEDVLTDFSSRGPAFPLNRIVPDIVAQGQNVLSGYGVTTAGPGPLWEPWAGTSASGPVVAGAAALVKAAHPDWSPWQIKSALMTTSKREVWVDFAQTTLGGPMEVGAGRVQVDKALDPGVFVQVTDPDGVIPGNVSAMFGLMQPGESKTLTVNFYSAIGVDATWTLSLENPFTLPVTLSDTAVTVPAGGMASVDLTLDLPIDMMGGDYWGYLYFEHGPHSGHIPFWVRVQAPPVGKEVLLIDDDGSFLQPIFFGVDTPDYRPYYEAMLQNLGVSYDVWDAEQAWLQGPGLPDIATLQLYDKVIWFTGDSFLTYYGVTADASDRVRLLDFFHNTPGRKLIVTGQDWSGYFADFVNGADSGCVLCSLGVANWAEDAYRPAQMALSPYPSAVGVGPFDGMLLDMGTVMTPTIDTTAGNQGYVDGLSPDGIASPEWTGQAAFQALVPPVNASMADVPNVATLRGADPRLEWFLMGDPEGTTTSTSRAIYFAFGLEGVSNAHADLGFATREDVLRRAFEWLDDQVTISVSGPASVNASEIVTFTASITSTMPYTQPFTFRWSWGDGTPIQPSGTSNVSAHTFSTPGTYTVMVEGTDPLGHTAVASMQVTVNPNPIQPVHWVTETVTLEPSADTTIDAWAIPWAAPTAGPDPNLIVRGKDIRTALLAFDLTGLPAGSEVVSAQLKLYATNGKGIVTIGAYNLLRPWSEANATWWEADVGVKWDQAGANGAGDREATPTDTQVVNGSGWVTFDVTAAAQSWLAGEGFGVALRGDDAALGGQWFFISRDFPEPALRPALEVTYRYPVGP